MTFTSGVRSSPASLCLALVFCAVAFPVISQNRVQGLGQQMPTPPLSPPSPTPNALAPAAPIRLGILLPQQPASEAVTQTPMAFAPGTLQPVQSPETSLPPSQRVSCLQRGVGGPCYMALRATLRALEEHKVPPETARLLSGSSPRHLILW